LTFIGTSVRRKLLYRTAVALVTLCMVGVLLMIPASGQYRKQQRQQSQLRALGLIEFGVKGKPRLVPISILVNGKFYDASIYRASPVPMAVEPGTVYEGFRTGTPVGLFTISTPETLNGNWRAQGTWKLESATTRSASASKKPTFKSGSKEDSDRPVLKRPGASSSSGSPSQTSSPPPSDSKEDDDRPVLKRPGSSSTSDSGSQTSSPAPGSPPPPGTSAPTSPAPAGSTQQTGSSPAAKNTGTASASSDDSGRPTLRRGKPEEEQADFIPEPGSPPVMKNSSAPSTSVPGAKSAPPAAFSGGTQAVAAISDTDGPEPRPYTYDVKPDDRQAYMKKVAEMATAAVTKFEKSRDPQFSACPLEDTSMRSFDPDYSNEPDLVFTAHCTISAGSATRGRRAAPASPGEKRGEAWVTVVARVDLYGEPRQLFASVTDIKHLDEVPRLELIDAVDADGDGRGELLFREFTDTGKAFIVYRVGADKLYPLFEGASGQ